MADHHAEQPVGATVAPVLTLSEAARLSGVSVQALRQRIARGTLPGTTLEQDGKTLAGVERTVLEEAFGELREPDELDAEQPEHPPRSKAEQSAGATVAPMEGRAADELRAVAIVAERGRGEVAALRRDLEVARERHAVEVDRLERDRLDARRWGRGAAIVGLALGLAGAISAIWTTRTVHAAAEEARAGEVDALRRESAAQERLSRALEGSRDREDLLSAKAAREALRASDAEARLRALVGAAAARVVMRVAVGATLLR